MREWKGTGSNAPGLNVEPLGDVDADGVPDIANNIISTASGVGGVRVFSGRSGALLWERFGTTARENHGFPMRVAGDIDGDGAPDLLAGSSAPSPWLTLYSGRTGAKIMTFPGGGAGPGDVNQDGWPDLLLGWHDCVEGRFLFDGRVRLLSGRDFSVLHTWCGKYANQGLGLLEHAGDIDADGVADILIGAGGNWPLTGRDGFWVYSGRGYALLYRIPPPPGTDSFPLALDGVGDVNADGSDDVAASDIGVRVSRTRNEVNVYGGPDGAKLFTLRSPLPAAQGLLLGSWVSGPGDVDGDGHDDVYTGDSQGGGYSVGVVFSGRDQSVLWQIVGIPFGTPEMVVFVTGNSFGDLDGDEFPDLAITGGDAVDSWLRIYSGAPDGVATLGTGCADARGIVPRIGMSRPAALGTTCSLNLARVRPGVPAALLLGASATSWAGGPLPLELGALGLRGCFLRASPDLVLVLPTRGTGEKGWIAQPVLIPAHPALAGARFFAQWLVLDLLHGASTTRALDVTVVAPGS